MITRLEATRYRCFERLGVDVGDFRVLVGANGSGKTTLLDLPVLLGDLLRANNVSAPFMERRPELPPRAGSLNELVFAGRGSDFSLAVEARLPEAVQSKVLEGLFASKRTERSRQALQEDRRQWPTHIRYEIGLRIGADQSLLVAFNLSASEVQWEIPAGLQAEVMQGHGLVSGEVREGNLHLPAHAVFFASLA